MGGGAPAGLRASGVGSASQAAKCHSATDGRPRARAPPHRPGCPCGMWTPAQPSGGRWRWLRLCSKPPAGPALQHLRGCPLRAAGAKQQFLLESHRPVIPLSSVGARGQPRQGQAAKLRPHPIGDPEGTATRSGFRSHTGLLGGKGFVRSVGHHVAVVAQSSGLVALQPLWREGGGLNY